MSSVIETIERAQLRRVPQFSPGDRVKVHFQVIEGTRRRVQVFEGVVIKRQGHGARETFTVRKQSFGVGVERMFPLHSPKIERIELAARGDVRRAKLYYLRDRVGKRARVRERRYTGPEELVEPGLLHAPPADDAEASVAEEGAIQDTHAEGAAAQAAGEQPQADGAEAQAAGEQPQAEVAEAQAADEQPQAEVAVQAGDGQSAEGDADAGAPGEPDSASASVAAPDAADAAPAAGVDDAA